MSSLRAIYTLTKNNKRIMKSAYFKKYLSHFGPIPMGQKTILK